MKRKILRGDILQVALMFVNKLGSGVAGYAMFIIIAKALGPEDFGNFSQLYSLALVAGIAGSFGQQIFLVKEAANLNSREDQTYSSGLYRDSKFSTVIFSAICCISLFLYATFIILPTPNHATILAALPIAFFYALTQTTIGELRTFDRTQLALFTRDFLWRAIICAGAALIYKFTPPEQRYTATMLLISLSIAGIAVFHLLVAANEKRKLSDNGLSLDRKAAFKASIGLTLIAVISGSDSYIFTLLAGQIGGNDYAGAFFSSIRTTEAVNLFLMAITLVYANKLSKAVAKRNFKELQSLCNALMILQIIPVLAVSTVIIFFNTEIISFFSPEYSKHTATLNLLVAGIIFNALTGSTVLLMQLLGLHWKQILLQGGFLIGSAGFALALSSFTEPEVVALSYLVAKVGWNYFAIKSIKSACGVNPSVAAIFGSKHIPFSSVKSELLNKLRE